MQQPTAPELVILKALWNQQVLSARGIHEIVVTHLEWSYSSTRKTLDRMIEKDFVEAVLEGNKKVTEPG